MGDHSTLLRVELAYPVDGMNPNRKVNEFKKRAIQRGRKATAELLARSAFNLLVKEGRPLVLPDEGPIPFRVTYHPPPKGKVWDDDNAISALKWDRDGIAKALRVDDKRFAVQRPQWGKRVPRGMLVVEIGHA